ncbi:MAG: competence protein ComK [Bacilli bacterium]|jgi:hypothetical protein|nr:competence protein ComK [Bacilli bacterium]
MYNVVYEFNNKVFCKSMTKNMMFNTSLTKYIDSLCLLSGTTYESSLKSGKRILKNVKKLPIYLSIINDYLIPLGNINEGGSFWISAKCYLSCYEEKGITYIKFKDKMVIPCHFSIFTIKKQYQKYLAFDKLRKEKLSSYGINL